MTISTGSIVLQAEETWGWDNLAPLAGSFRNLFWDDGTDGVVWGRQFGKFNFDFVRINFKFSNVTPTIPKDAQILSAVLRGTASLTTDSTDFFSIIRTLTRDGIWNLDETDGWQTASSVNGPHGTLRTAAKVVVRNVIFAPLADTGVSPNSNWPIRDNANERGRRAGQGVDIVTPGTLGFVDIEIDKSGTGGAGDIWAEIYTQNANGLADTLLATSTVRPASDAPATPGVLTFAFPVGEQIPLSVPQSIVVVLNADYPLSGVNNVGMRWRGNAGYTPGTFQIDGLGKGFNSQNSPMQINFRNIPGDGFVIWIAPQFITGVDYDTPDLSAMLENHLQVSSYVEGDSLAFSVERSLFLNPATTARRTWASVLHGSFQPVRLIVEWRVRPPRFKAGVTVLDERATAAAIIERSTIGVVCSNESGIGVTLREGSSVGVALGLAPSAVTEAPGSITRIVSGDESILALPAKRPTVGIVFSDASGIRMTARDRSDIEVSSADGPTILITEGDC